MNSQENKNKDFKNKDQQDKDLKNKDRQDNLKDQDRLRNPDITQKDNLREREVESSNKDRLGKDFQDKDRKAQDFQDKDKKVTDFQDKDRLRDKDLGQKDRLQEREVEGINKDINRDVNRDQDFKTQDVLKKDKTPISDQDKLGKEEIRDNRENIRTAQK